MKFIIMMLASVLMLGGCTMWPAEKGGGFVESQKYKAAKNTKFEVSELEENLVKANQKFDALVMQGAQSCFPGRVQLAKTQQSRVQREITGGLYSDAMHDLDVFEHQIKNMRRMIYSVENTRTCKKVVSRSVNKRTQ